MCYNTRVIELKTVAGAVLATPSRLTPRLELVMPPHDTTIPDGFKRCTRCREVKPATTEFFHRDSSRGDGFCYVCRPCEADRKRLTPPKPIPKDGYRICSKCGEEKLDTAEFFPRGGRNSDYLYSQCKTCRKAYSAAYRETRREEAAATTRAWRKNNPERALEAGRSWAVRHPDSIKVSRAKIRAKRKKAEGVHTTADIQAQYARQHGKCYYCGEKVGDDYHVDHIVPLSRGGTNWPDNLVIACPSCNISKNAKLPHEWPQGGRLL